MEYQHTGYPAYMGLLIVVLAVVLLIVGVVQLLGGQLIFGIVLILVGLVLAGGGYARR